MIHSVQLLLDEIEAGFRPKYLHFWGHTPRKANVIDKSCFSQWFPSPFEVDNVTYPTAEHFMMAGKARLFGDDEMLANILAASHPKQAKGFGRKVRGYQQAVWEANRHKIVLQANIAKFSQNQAMGDYLRTTEARVLVEASPYDAIWGIGLRASHANAANPAKWRGLNLLGFVLMDTRSHLYRSA
ncbi:MAG: NADAR family protein [Candidatus Promineifilaceae bacterium]